MTPKCQFVSFASAFDKQKSKWQLITVFLKFDINQFDYSYRGGTTVCMSF